MPGKSRKIWNRDTLAFAVDLTTCAVRVENTSLAFTRTYLTLISCSARLERIDPTIQTVSHTSLAILVYNRGFYNNFLASLPIIKEHIEPMLGEDQPPRKLFVVGHSLGGGVATLAACYFLLEFDWATLPQSFVAVTAGAPRSCATSMKNLIDERMEKLGDAARLYRLVKDKDVVPKVPPTFMSFHHLGPPAYIDDTGTIHIKHASPVDTDGDADVDGLRSLIIRPVVSDDEGEESSEEKKYQKFISRIPKSFRDHMPEL